MTDLIGSDEGVMSMRIISQDGRISFPAEYTVVYVESDGAVMATTVDSPFGKLLASYSSESLAIKAVNRMNNTISDSNYRFPTEKMLCAG